MKDYISEAEALEQSGYCVNVEDEDEDDGYDGGVMWRLKRPQRKTPVQYSDGSVRYETVVKEVNGRVITSERQKDIKQLYDVAKAAKVGTMIICPTCKELHKKTTYHKVFCSNGKKSRKDCKSKYWNTIHPERLDRLF